MRQFLSSLLVLLSLSAMAQDTITVQTFTFDSITARRGTWQFPDDTHHYRKVLMLHTLKCDAATTQDQYPCGEWDYLTYHFIHEHTGLMDSLALVHALFRVNAIAPPQVELLSSASNDHYQRYELERVVDAIGTSSDHAIGSNDATDTRTLDASSGEARTQFILSVDELNDLTEVDAIRLALQQVGTGMHRVVIRMKNTVANDLTSFDNNALVTVYDHSTTFAEGVNTLTLLTPFTTAGVNVLVDLSITGTDAGSTATVAASQTTHPVLHAQREGHLQFNDGRVGVEPIAFAGVNDAITITFRAFGGASLPVDNSILEAFDANGQRLLNIHLPWSDGSVYWDAGNAGYDRISKAAATAETEGQWNNWAFVKNTATGSMKIYLNGVLWQSGTGKTIPMSGIASFNFGANGTAQNPYPGAVDDLNIFNTELDQATIQAWMNKRVGPSHPQFAALVCGLPFDDADNSFDLENVASNGARAWALGRTQHVHTSATDLQDVRQADPVRPDLVLVQADLTSHLDTMLVTDDVIHTGIALEYFQVQGNAAVPLDTLFGWEALSETTYAPDGSFITFNPSGTDHVNADLDYFGAPFEVVKDHEIGRYITPYGINLTLGPSGFTWVYDVTDYQHLLHGSVDVSAGNQQELIDLRFMMIEGDPGRAVLDVLNPWGPQRSFSYGDLSSDNALSAVDVALSPSASQWMMRSRLTGHGDASSSAAQGCCEFKDNTHTLSANGAQIDSWHIWQTNDCALNPLYPQGGTWLESREGWCPGDVVKERMTELTPYVSNGHITLDYGITPVPANNPGMANGNYQVNMDLFEFGAPTHAFDAEIYDVKRPSDDRYRSRENPICYDPVVVLRNAGGEELTDVSFDYRVSGGQIQSYTWHGSLKHMAMTDVALPIPNGDFWTGDDEHLFFVSVHSPNGVEDEYTANDDYRTHFTLPTLYPENFILNYLTNNRPQDNSVFVRNVHGDVVFSRTSLAANTTYKDTLHLDPGCYTLDVEDTGNDGLSYWADPAQGNGTFRLRALNNTLLKNFQAEFGRSIHYAFSIGSITNIAELASVPGLVAMPNPSEGFFTLRTRNVSGAVTIAVFNILGSEVRSERAYIAGEEDLKLDLTDLASGPYTVRLITQDGSAMVRVVKQ